MALTPSLEPRSRAGIHFLTDPGAHAAGVLVAFFDRRGGVSGAPYDTLNLALRSADDPDRVIENRRRAAAAAGLEGSPPALARQVHGAAVREVAAGESGVVGEADGLVARSEPQSIGILTADCAPVVVAGDNGVAVLHAGWRGVVSGIVERGLDALGDAAAAWIGPSIRACCYEVGPEVVDAFAARDLPVSDARHVDPAAAAARILRRSGIARIAVAQECTMCSRNYFSHRRDGITGRQGAFVALVENG